MKKSRSLTRFNNNDQYNFPQKSFEGKDTIYSFFMTKILFNCFFIQFHQKQIAALHHQNIYYKLYSKINDIS